MNTSRKKKHGLNGYQTLHDLSSIIEVWQISYANINIFRSGCVYLVRVVLLATGSLLEFNLFDQTPTRIISPLFLCFHKLQILALRLLRAVLPSWDVTKESCRMSEVVARLFALLGRVLMTCHGSLPIQPPSGM